MNGGKEMIKVFTLILTVLVLGILMRIQSEHTDWGIAWCIIFLVASTVLIVFDIYYDGAD
jgi:hypothetical protein